jgi:hypothetical protein
MIVSRTAGKIMRIQGVKDSSRRVKYYAEVGKRIGFVLLPSLT